MVQESQTTALRCHHRELGSLVVTGGDSLGFQQGLCTGVSLDTEKSVLKQGAVQHLYGRLSGQLLPGCNDAHLLVSHLVPDAAVCSTSAPDLGNDCSDSKEDVLSTRDQVFVSPT